MVHTCDERTFELFAACLPACSPGQVRGLCLPLWPHVQVLHQAEMHRLHGQKEPQRHSRPASPHSNKDPGQTSEPAATEATTICKGPQMSHSFVIPCTYL